MLFFSFPPPQQPPQASLSLENVQVARSHYRAVLIELFANQINWGRIIAMFSFLRALCQTLDRSRSASLVRSQGGSQVIAFRISNELAFLFRTVCSRLNLLYIVLRAA